MKKFAANESGASLVEYGLLVGLIAVVAIAAVTELGARINHVFMQVNTNLANAGLGN